MAISFGLSRLRAFTDGIDSGVTVAAGASSGSATIASGYCWIGGKLCSVSGSSVDGAAGLTGIVYIFAYLPAGNSSTANVSLTGVSPTGTNVAILADASYGTGSNIFSDFSASGYTGMRAFGRAQNMTLNISYDTAQARGGTLIFANDLKLYNGACEGTLEYANISGANLASILGASWASGGAGSGTLTLSATQTPLNFMIETQQVTDGVTATIRVLNCKSTQLGLNIDRENYLIPTLNFMAVGNQEGDLLTYQI